MTVKGNSDESPAPATEQISPDETKFSLRDQRCLKILRANLDRKFEVVSDKCLELFCSTA